MRALRFWSFRSYSVSCRGKTKVAIACPDIGFGHRERANDTDERLGESLQSTEVCSNSLESVADRLASFEERQDAVAKGTWDALEKRYTQTY